MELSATTRISTILRENPAAIEAIVSINKHFEKLRNPVLRKVLASRVTIADAARIGKCRVEDFYEKLEPLGFSIASKPTHSKRAIPMENDVLERPAFMANLKQEDTLVLDVRDTIAKGDDPFLQIMDAVNKLNPEQVLCIVNTFEPIPLIAIIRPKGFEYYTETLGPHLVKTYFKKQSAGEEVKVNPTVIEENFDELLARYSGKLQPMDVRQMEMPQPMVSILGALETLPKDKALYVHHRKVPQFLLPQLTERGFKVSIKEVGPNEVNLLIYR
ncbi:DUF2249 domain-containing protein [Pontibacter sp. HSC-14F20]|uniref:DUF2249 domain-containing protein n=1 Tax=Pontibacter sp. HSC-14F20 TaxID=2864136 RepID=UPI001C734978|nr:DUF2249 domain-containing protein [Pontibacter sp. HSC-14F20]MBX0332323.1 DUF2249 domain-containing protein [Pontibacter sp. HSC-14F20]